LYKGDINGASYTFAVFASIRNKKMIPNVSPSFSYIR